MRFNRKEIYLFPSEKVIQYNRCLTPKQIQHEKGWLFRYCITKFTGISPSLSGRFSSWVNYYNFKPNIYRRLELKFKKNEKWKLQLDCSNDLFTDEIAKQLKDADAKMVFTLPELFPVVSSALQIMQKDIPIVVAKLKEDSPIPTGLLFRISGHDIKNSFKT